ncbi:hypothetical protein ABL78_7968 [Leptomonas seymouri]|uniref:Uncharacterized protein n=1 Tax=Leptomonas seymouri TaxID=5684 RepID=A0A0N1P983_LEPSE|nr:hypothetical protein ABL78_7968 [Leptomonas seymouri]|eukprot:KPI83012.1 hypothetical protein ABL78_7968 [Leptomonas seymouri]
MCFASSFFETTTPSPSFCYCNFGSTLLSHSASTKHQPRYHSFSTAPHRSYPPRRPSAVKATYRHNQAVVQEINGHHLRFVVPVWRHPLNPICSCFVSHLILYTPTANQAATRRSGGTRVRFRGKAGDGGVYAADRPDGDPAEYMASYTWIMAHPLLPKSSAKCARVLLRYSSAIVAYQSRAGFRLASVCRTSLGLPAGHPVIYFGVRPPLPLHTSGVCTHRCTQTPATTRR